MPTKNNKKEHSPYIPIFSGIGLAVICFMLLFAGICVVSTTDYVIVDGNDNVAVQEAIGSLGPEGGTVILPAGIYTFYTKVDVPADVTIQGEGRDKTIIHNDNGGDQAAYEARTWIGKFAFNTIGDNVRYTEMHLVGPEILDPYGPSGETYTGKGIYAKNTENVRIDHNEMESFGHATVYCEESSCLIDHNYIHNNYRRGYGYGAYVQGHANGKTFIEDNSFGFNRHDVAACCEARYVARHNYIKSVTTYIAASASLDAHTSTIEGEIVEWYNNIIEGDQTADEPYAAFHPRGCTAIIFDNTIAARNSILAAYAPSLVYYWNNDVSGVWKDEIFFWEVEPFEIYRHPPDGYEPDTYPHPLNDDPSHPIDGYGHFSSVGKGTISGTVTDKDTGNSIEGATVTADGYSDPDGTDSNGNYLIENVPTGTYTVTASKTGYHSQSQTNVQVLDGQTTTLDFQLTEAPDLVGLWHFEEGSGTTAADSSGNGNDGTLINMDPVTDWVDGKLGKALRFDGADDYIEIPKSASLDSIIDEITLIAWVNTPVSAGHCVMERWLYGSGVNERGFEFEINDDGSIDFGLCADGTSTNVVWLTSNNAINVNTWAHLVATSDGTTMKIYINGEQDPNTARPPAGIHVSTTDLHIGRWKVVDGWNKPFNGTIDEVKIYNRALTPEEIQADYETGLEDPSADFSATPTRGQKPLTVAFSDNSISHDGIVAWEWDFDNDDVTDSTEQNPTYVYAEDGVYTVSLKVTESDGDGDTRTKADYITVTGKNQIKYIWLESEDADILTPDFEIASDTSASNGEYIQIPEGVGFQAHDGEATYTIAIASLDDYVIWGRKIAATDDDNSFFVQIEEGTRYLWTTALSDNWQWDAVNHLGSGGEFDPEIDPVVFTLSAGEHTVRILQREDGAKLDKLLITNDIACSNIPALNNPPTAFIDSITPDPAEQGKDIVSFSGHGTDTDGTVVAYNWRSSKDGLLSTASSFSKPASELSAGTHTIYFKVQDNDGAWSTEVTKDLTIIGPAKQAAVSDPSGPYTGTEGVPIAYDGSDSYYTDGSIVAYEWDFGDGGTATGVAPTHAYAQKGTYSVSLTVTDNDGATNTSTTTATVADTEPVADFSAMPTSGLGPLTVAFTDASTSHDGIEAWSWDFDSDGKTDSTEQNPTHVYAEEGVYTVCLTVTESDGDRDTMTKTDYISVITINNAPDTPPIVSNPSATPDTILNDNGRPRIPGTNISQLSVTVTDDSEVDTVTIDLSPIGGFDEAQMTNIPGTDTWTITTNAVEGINIAHDLIVTATDTNGNSDSSVSIQLTILRRGDVDHDNDVDRADALKIRKYINGHAPDPGVFIGDVYPATGDNAVDRMDASYIFEYVSGKADEP